MICDKCRQEVTKLKNTELINDKNAENEDSSGSETITIPDEDPDFTTTRSMVVEALNTSLQELGESAIDQ